MLLVYRYRVKCLEGLLKAQARAVNFCWNYCNETQKSALKWHKRWPSGFDLNKLTAGTSKELCLRAGTINAVCEQYAKSRNQKKRPSLRWRGRRSLGWVPLKGRDLRREGDAFRFAGNTFRVFYSRPLPEGKIKDGTHFACDARGRWFLNIVIEVADSAPRQVAAAVGIDLGLKEFAALSTGENIDNPRHLQKLAGDLAVAQRAGNWQSPFSMPVGLASATSSAIKLSSTAHGLRRLVSMVPPESVRLAQGRRGRKVSQTSE